MPTLQKTVRLHRVQHQFCHSPALYRAFVGGRGSGKSFAACYDLIRRAKRGRTYLLAAPTYPMLFDSEFRTFTNLARELGVLGEVKASAPAHCRLTTGAEILFRSADDPERLRGPNLSGAVLMEASLMAREVYDIAIACLRQNGESGFLTAAMTPRGPNHWSYEVFATGRPDTALFRAPTRSNPFLPPGFEDTIRRQYGDTQFARQELDGDFVQVEGAEFPAEWFDWPGFWFEEWPSDIWIKVVYLDPSKGRDGKTGDYQAHVMAGLDRANTLFLDAEMHREPVTAMLARTVRICREWGPVASACLEDNGTMGFIAPEAERQSTGLLIPWHAVTNRDPKAFRIRCLGDYLSTRRLRIRNTPGGKLLRAQMGDFPLGEHDDGPDAAAGAVRRLEQLTTGRA